MTVKVLVYRDTQCLANNQPCVRESLDVDNTFDFNVLIQAFKLVWSDCIINFSI